MVLYLSTIMRIKTKDFKCNRNTPIHELIIIAAEARVAKLLSKDFVRL